MEDSPTTGESVMPKKGYMNSLYIFLLSNPDSVLIFNFN